VRSKEMEEIIFSQNKISFIALGTNFYGSSKIAQIMVLFSLWQYIPQVKYHEHNSPLTNSNIIKLSPVQIRIRKNT
jgi:hypothetical protein